MDRLGRKHLYPLIHHAGPGKALFWNRFFYLGVMIADPEAIANSLGSQHQPFFMLTNFSFSAMVSALEKARVFKLHLYICSLEFLACLRKTDRACGSQCIVQTQSPLQGRENLLSQLVWCCWHQIPAISPFRDCLSCSEAALAMVELWLVDMLNPDCLGSAHCCSAETVLLQSSPWAAWLLFFFLISVSCQFLLPFPFFL